MAHWSTAGRRRSVGRLFGDLPIKSVEPARGAESGRGPSIYTIAPADPRSAAERVLREFASRAFRRPVTSADVVRLCQIGACAGSTTA